MTTIPGMTPELRGAMMARPLPALKAEGGDVAKAAGDFEACLLGIMMQSLFEGVPTDGLTGGGLSEQIFRSLLLDEYGKTLARHGGLGLQKAIVSSVERRTA
jgi:flagellar protein FlgJ